MQFKTVRRKQNLASDFGIHKENSLRILTALDIPIGRLNIRTSSQHKEFTD